MRVLQVCAEIFPLLKTGGLADVAGALPRALNALGAETRMLLPGFEPILAGLHDAQEVAALPAHLGGGGARLLAGWLPACELTAYVIDAPHLYRRDGGPYGDAQQRPYPDNHLRFALLGRLGAELGRGFDPAWRPAVVHAHDWHAGLAPAYLRAAERYAGPGPGSVFTVHNLAYQGLFAPHHFGELGLPGDFFHVQGLEFYGQISFMKGGLFHADRLSTVSPTYAHEIQQPEQGCGLDGLLTTRAPVLSGILNGVDDQVWSPLLDKGIAARFDASKLAGKARCKAALQKELGLASSAKGPLLCVVSRLSEQKGLHLVLAALPAWLARGGQFGLLGSGDAGMEAAFRELAQAHPKQVGVRIGYDEEFAHRLIAGSDLIAVPSRFEPCGLTQLYGLKYGTLPLVRRVGGLADTVVDSNLENLVDDLATGVVFEGFTTDALIAGMRHAMALYRRPDDWAQVQQAAMRQVFNWESAAAQYLALYRQLRPQA